MEVSIPKRKKRKKKWVWGSVAGLTFVILSALIYGNVYISKSLPVTEGAIELSPLNGNVDVVRDDNGVPHITAEDERDLYIAQGYVQAQDRLFQMDLSRRQASGELSEVIGKAALDRDKFFRTLGLRRAAGASLDTYTEEARKVLEWYSEGVNAYMEDAKENGTLPIEFTLLGYEPKEWTPIDSLTIGKYMAFDLGGHWQGQAFRYWAIENLPNEKALDLFPSYPKDAPTILAEYEEIDLDISQSFAAAVIPPEFNGSNNWVVSGEKSVSGKPLLADDPHLGLGTPSIWYQMHLNAPEMNVSGVIFAGVPGIILGHNDQIAWGVTNTGPDVQDLYIEKRNPNNPKEFLYKEKWEKAKIIKEPIKVKDEETVPYEVTVTRHGPIINEFAYETMGNTALAMRWTALDPSNELQAILEINKATNWGQFEMALKDFHVPTQNFVFASADGTIAYKANGKIPIRKKGDGILPVPGWTDEYEWEGFIPYDELPRVVNPEKGFIATANNKVVDNPYPYHISHHWAQPYRYMRIKEFLEEKEKLSLIDMKTLQMDQKNLHAVEFLQSMVVEIEQESLTRVEKEAVAELKEWNFIDDKSQAAPLLFNLWMKEIPNVLFNEEIPKGMRKLFTGKASVVDELLRKAFDGNVSPWIAGQGGISKVLHQSFSNVKTNLQEEYGSSPESWQWGDYHQLYFAHPVSSSSDILAFFFNREKPIPVGGSHVTVQAASYGEDGIADHGASWRFIMDTSNMAIGEHIVGPGQSGHIKSRWYDDQIGDWVKGTYHQTSLNGPNKEVEKLILTPSE
ncbi:penicillin amidase [Bacillus pakistanensis]|uniref:Penicillin amidase n=1 Tax=Rossellomorea pakistanensis TaxID=992288 RepID=A0ABS2NGM8_9BACI|nr:penicillin acylase family protein [Bacillus pakistanensis]MBM7586960.1 penicillin amidase [Bacillus pakistanensis]